MRIKATAASSAGFTLATGIAVTVAAFCTLLLIALFIPAAYGGEMESGAAAQPSESGATAAAVGIRDRASHQSGVSRVRGARWRAWS